MVSLKKVAKNPKMYEVTPVHLTDEVSPVTQTPKATQIPSATDDAQLTSVKDESEKKAYRLDKRDFIEAFIIGALLTAFLFFVCLLFGNFISEGLQLAKDIAFGN